MIISTDQSAYCTLHESSLLLGTDKVKCENALVGGGFGGVLGMFLGVPVFACLQALVKFLVDRRLEKRNMPLEAHKYVGREPADSAKKEEKGK